MLAALTYEKAWKSLEKQDYYYYYLLDPFPVLSPGFLLLRSFSLFISCHLCLFRIGPRTKNKSKKEAFQHNYLRHISSDILPQLFFVYIEMSINTFGRSITFAFWSESRILMYKSISGVRGPICSCSKCACFFTAFSYMTIKKLARFKRNASYENIIIRIVVVNSSSTSMKSTIIIVIIWIFRCQYLTSFLRTDSLTTPSSS